MPFLDLVTGFPVHGESWEPTCWAGGRPSPFPSLHITLWKFWVLLNSISRYVSHGESKAEQGQWPHYLLWGLSRSHPRSHNSVQLGTWGQELDRRGANGLLHLTRNTDELPYNFHPHTPYTDEMWLGPSLHRSNTKWRSKGFQEVLPGLIKTEGQKWEKRESSWEFRKKTAGPQSFQESSRSQRRTW